MARRGRWHPAIFSLGKGPRGPVQQGSGEIAQRGPLSGVHEKVGGHGRNKRQIVDRLGLPSRDTAPCCGAQTPASIRASVDLPELLWPMTATTSPTSRPKLMLGMVALRADGRPARPRLMQALLICRELQVERLEGLVGSVRRKERPPVSGEGLPGRIPIWTNQRRRLIRGFVGSSLRPMGQVGYLR